MRDEQQNAVAITVEADTIDTAENKQQKSSTNKHVTTSSVFDPKNYRTKYSTAEPSSKKKQGTIPVRKPGSEYFFMASPDPEYRATLPLLQDKEQNTYYLLSHNFSAPPEVDARAREHLVVTCVFIDGTVFLWPISEATNTWAESAREALYEATTTWVRLMGNRVSGGYDISYPRVTPKPPQFPTAPFSELLERAFKPHLIDSPKHPYVKKLLGE